MREAVAARAPGLSRGGADRARAGRRRAGSTALERLLDPKAAERRAALLEVARAVYRDPDFEPAARRLRRCSTGVRAHAAEAKARGGGEARAGSTCPTREAEQRVAPRARGAEREELLATLEELAAWYRDLVVVAARARARRSSTSTGSRSSTRTATRERLAGAERAAEHVRETWRQLEEFNLNPQLALEALFVRLRRELAAV